MHGNSHNPRLGQINSDPKDLQLKAYHYDLPRELVAERPLPADKRDHSKLLVCDQGTDQVSHRHFFDLPQELPPNSLLVFNDTKVFPCRLHGMKSTGGKAELFVLDIHPDENGNYEALVRSNGKKEIGDEFIFSDEADTTRILRIKISGKTPEDTFLIIVCQLNNAPDLPSFLQAAGQIPIPPYIRKGTSDARDKHDYQTVYAQNSGATAAPTAGFHFTPGLMQKLKAEGHEEAYVTLHVGPGTFKSVTAQNILEHKMHQENFFITEQNWRKIEKARVQNRPVIAVGTTSLRALESALTMDDFQPGRIFPTRIFLYPGQPVRSIQGLITNFHLPESTLLMLVSALVGREKILNLYKEAVQHNYRFFSYGDAMYIKRKLD